MIDLSIYLATVAILSGIIVAFVIHNLREPRTKDSISKLKKHNESLIHENTNLQKTIRNLKDYNDEQQKQITNNSAKVDMISKYTFKRGMGCLVSRANGKFYCTECMLKFIETPLKMSRKPAHCQRCGAEYPQK